MRVLGIDVGGTFTDAVLLEGDRIATAKVLTSERQEESVVAAARAVGAHGVDRFAHGTTIATNALLEHKGARTAFVTTAGFEHLLHLRRQTRAHLYRLCADHPPPLVALDDCHGVRERISVAGVLEALDLDSLPALEGIEAAAVCTLFSFRDPTHERAIADELRARHPRVHVVASHEVAPEFREYERASTTVADAYLGPVTARYFGAIGARCAGRRASRRPGRARRRIRLPRRRCAGRSSAAGAAIRRRRARPSARSRPRRRCRRPSRSRPCRR